MPLQSSVRASKKPLRLDDEVRFLRSWIEKPLHMGAVMPSGRLLARTMAQYVDADAEGPVVELGPGTGAITNALIEHGVDQKRLVLVEYNPGFCALLRERYPQAKVVQGYQGIMPAFQGLVTEEQLLELIEFLKSPQTK